MKARDEPRRVQGAQEGTDTPAAIHPSVADRATVDDAIVQWSGNYARGQHRAEKERPADSHQHHGPAAFEVHETVMQLVQESCQSTFARYALFGLQLFRIGYNVAPSSHQKVTVEGENVGSEIEQEHAAEVNMVINEADDSTCDQPSALYASHEEGVGLYELPLWR